MNFLHEYKHIKSNQINFYNANISQLTDSEAHSAWRSVSVRCMCIYVCTHVTEFPFIDTYKTSCHDHRVTCVPKHGDSSLHQPP